MYLQHLELVDFRNYVGLRLDLEPGIAVFVGANAQGKTNLLEAVHYLAIGASHRTSSDAPLVRHRTPAAVVRAIARSGSEQRRLRVELELRPGGRSRVRVNGQPQARMRDGLGLIRSVLFAPEDLQLVRGDPAERRRFLDELLAQRRPAYHAARTDYERVLRQRNALLRELRSARRAGDESSLPIWTDALVRAGATVLAARLAAVHALASPLADAYADLIAASPEHDLERAVTLRYDLSTGRGVVASPGAGVPDPAGLAEELRDGLRAREGEERLRGVTLAGPHRDDLHLSIGELPAKGYASHGEHWSLALALRLASRAVLAEVGDEPVVLLDDVFAELDADRRRRLAQRCESFPQVLVTTAVDADVPLDGLRLLVHHGVVQAVTA